MTLKQLQSKVEALINSGVDETLPVYLEDPNDYLTYRIVDILLGEKDLNYIIPKSDPDFEKEDCIVIQGSIFA